MDSHVVSGEFRRPASGLHCELKSAVARSLPLSGLIGWQSNGGPTRRHPDRALPYSLEVDVPAEAGRLMQLHLVGVFALHADPTTEPYGAIGATVQLVSANEVVFRHELVQGRHYSDARERNPVFRLQGDSTCIETIGVCDGEGGPFRVDRITLDIPFGANAGKLVFRDLGTSASFVLFDVLFEFDAPAPREVDRLELYKVGSAMRLRNRVAFERTLDRLRQTINEPLRSLAEAREVALAFLTVAHASAVEMGAAGGDHRFPALASAELAKAPDKRRLTYLLNELATLVTKGVIARGPSSGDPLVDRALMMLERSYARDVGDDEIAADLGLSTSHFRYLFRRATQQPFHKYLLALRLERAREMLLRDEMPVSEVAEAVGFQSPAHFSRAFAKRFDVSPSAYRQTRRP